MGLDGRQIRSPGPASTAANTPTNSGADATTTAARDAYSFTQPHAYGFGGSHAKSNAAPVVQEPVAESLTGLYNGPAFHPLDRALPAVVQLLAPSGRHAGAEASVHSPIA